MFDKDYITAVCEHMNDDHSDANLAYVQAYSDIINPASATLTDITATHIILTVQDTDGNTHTDIQIAFDRPITNEEQIHGKLISLVRKARKDLENS